MRPLRGRTSTKPSRPLGSATNVGSQQVLERETQAQSPRFSPRTRASTSSQAPLWTTSEPKPKLG